MEEVLSPPKSEADEKDEKEKDKVSCMSLDCCSCHRTSISPTCMHAVPDAPQCRRTSTVLHNATRTL